MPSARSAVVRWRWLLCLMLLSAAVAWPAGTARADVDAMPLSCTPVVPCGDSRGCPDLVIDPGYLAGELSIITQTFAATDCDVVEGDTMAGTRRLLQFATTSVNIGPGALVLGDPYAHPDWFDLVTCHNHPHLKDYAAFRLWTLPGWSQWKALRAAAPDVCSARILADHPELAPGLFSGVKHAFCLLDDYFSKKAISVACPYTPDPYTFTCAYQGLGVCGGDVYFVGLPGQYIDITGLPDGEYVLENEINDRHFMTETSYTNDWAAVDVVIRGKIVKQGKMPL